MSEPKSAQAGRARPDVAPEGGDVEEMDSSSLEPVPPSAEETAALLKTLVPGVIIDGKYQVDQVIGKGAMGVVLAATHVHLKERVALKFLATRARSESDDFHSRFRREAQVSAKLRNEHITRVLDVGVWREKIPFMVMDLLVGDDLRRTLKQSPNGRLPASTALDFIVQVCEGLAEAHSHGIVHRDLKPSNLFVTKRHDGTELIKILDFGISKWSTHNTGDELDELTQTGVVLGSPKYMAPEQLFGSATVDARADVWSLGAILYEMLSGRPPYDFPTLTRICAELATDQPPPSLRQFVPDLPPALEGVVLQCFSRDRDKRIPSVAELAGALLESVEAPFAGQVRQRIASMLDPKGGTGQLSTSSSGGLPFSTGAYRSLAISGSHRSVSSSSAIRVGDVSPSSAATAGGVEAMVTGDALSSRRKPAVVAAVVGLIAALVVALLFMSMRTREVAKDVPLPTPVAPAAQPIAPPAPSPVPVVVATPPSTALAAVAPSAKPPAAPPAPPPRSRWEGHHAGGSRPAPPPAPPPPPPPVAQTAPTPAPAATPTPAPTAKANPLEDRQ